MTATDFIISGYLIFGLFCLCAGAVEGYCAIRQAWRKRQIAKMLRESEWGSERGMW